MMKSIFIKIICSCWLLFFLSGCLTIHNLNVQSGGSPQEPVAISPMTGVIPNNTTIAPAPITTMDAPEPRPPLSLASANPSYSIQPGDELDVKFYYNNDLNETVIVRPDGRISLQLVNDVQAAFLSPSELGSVLERKYSTHLKNPEISVILKSMQANKVFVDGEVYKAGDVDIIGNMSILQSIASAGGMKDSASSEDILLIRRNGLKRPFVYTVNLAAALAGTDIGQDVMVQASDIIFVPKSAIANVNVWVDQYIRKNIPIDVGVTLDAIRIK